MFRGCFWRSCHWRLFSQSWGRSQRMDMVEVASIFRDTIDGRIDTSEGAAHLEAISPAAPFANGFYHGKPGYTRSSTNVV
jgi:hypothetical protein